MTSRLENIKIGLKSLDQRDGTNDTKKFSEAKEFGDKSILVKKKEDELDDFPLRIPTEEELQDMLNQRITPRALDGTRL